MGGRILKSFSHLEWKHSKWCSPCTHLKAEICHVIYNRWTVYLFGINYRGIAHIRVMFGQNTIFFFWTWEENRVFSLLLVSGPFFLSTHFPDLLASFHGYHKPCDLRKDLQIGLLYILLHTYTQTKWKAVSGDRWSLLTLDQTRWRTLWRPGNLSRLRVRIGGRIHFSSIL